MPDRVRNAVVRFERWVERLPAPFRRAGPGLTRLLTGVIGSITGSDSAEPRVGLTFDDGPDPVVTPKILDLLRDRDVRATFFLLAERAEAHPGVVRRMVAEGHEVALHGASHDNLTTIGLRRAFGLVVGGRRRLRQVTGRASRLFRPPYGAQNLRTFALTRLTGMKVVVWSADPNDWDEIDPEVIVSRARGQTGPGSILLLHDGWTPSPDGEPSRPAADKAHVVELILNGLDDAGLQGTTVSDLLLSGGARKRIWFESG